IHFIPGPRECADGMNFWFPPALAHHGYKGMTEVYAACYDTGPILRWVTDRLVAHPLDFLVSSIGNALDLLGLEYWPEPLGNVTLREGPVMSQAFLVLVLVPGIAMW